MDNDATTIIQANNEIWDDINLAIMYLSKVAGAVALFIFFLSFGWFVAWKMILSKMKFFQEIFANNNTDEKRLKKKRQVKAAQRRRVRRSISISANSATNNPINR